jgi:hypothetical protein
MSIQPIERLIIKPDTDDLSGILPRSPQHTGTHGILGDGLPLRVSLIHTDDGLPEVGESLTKALT